MKKLFWLITFLLLIPQIAFANIISYEQHILFSSLPSDLKTEVELLGEGPNEGLFFSGNNISTFKLSDGKESQLYQNRFLVHPPSPGMNSYKFWQISGTYEDKNFLVFGYTIDVGGDTWLENSSLTVDIIKMMVFISFIGIIIFFIRKKQKNRFIVR